MGARGRWRGALTKENSAITELDLTGNMIRDGGARALTEALKVSALSELDLTGNAVGEEDALPRALADQLKAKSALTDELHLSTANSVKVECAWALARALKDKSGLTDVDDHCFLTRAPQNPFLGTAFSVTHEQTEPKEEL